MMNKVNDQHKILVLVVPTNEPETCKNFFLKSLEYMKEVAPLTTIAFNFQKPWTEEDIKMTVERCEELGFKVVHSFNEYTWEEKGHVPFNKIRYDAAKLVPDALLYALTDDDFQYRGHSATIHKTAGDQYVDAIDYLLSYQKCGLVLMGGTMFKAIPRNHIGPVKLNSVYLTGRGYIMKNLNMLGGNGLILPDEALSLVGADEERIAAGARLSKGYYPAKMGFARTSHYELHQRGKVQPGTEMYGWSKEDIVEMNASKFIRENYNPDYVKHDNGFDVCSRIKYAVAGGFDVDNKDFVEEYTKDYTNSNSVDTINKIINTVVE